MPVHDWTRVDAAIFHHFHLCWLNNLMRELNRRLLPSDYYVLATRNTAGPGPDEPARSGAEGYALRANHAVIRHTSNHQVHAICEIVSPGIKSSRYRVRSFVDKAVSILRAGIHLVVLDLFPPGPQDPQGIHKAIWDEFIDDDDFTLPPDKSLTLVSYIGGPAPQAFVEPISVGARLPEMPLFLAPEVYVPLPLETTYQSAWEAVPSYWQNVLSAPPAAGDQPQQ